MVADVSYLFRLMNEHQAMNDSKSTALITRDLLGGRDLELDSSKELDLDFHVPSGFEKRLDLKSGKVYLQRCNSANCTTSCSSSFSSEQRTTTTDEAAVVSKSKLQDLNFPPSGSGSGLGSGSSKEKELNLLDHNTNLELKLQVSLSSSSAFAYQSVCTLDKVKSALERAEKQTPTIKKRKPNSICSSNSSSSVKETTAAAAREAEDGDDDDSPPPPPPPPPVGPGPGPGGAYAAGCPSCLLYVLISRSNPKCPRCNMIVPSPTLTPIPVPIPIKKPRIDLNMSISL